MKAISLVASVLETPWKDLSSHLEPNLSQSRRAGAAGSIAAARLMSAAAFMGGRFEKKRHGHLLLSTINLKVFFFSISSATREAQTFA